MTAGCGRHACVPVLSHHGGTDGREMMFGRDSARENWLEFQGWSDPHGRRLSRHGAAYHRRRFFAGVREWASALTFVVVSLWLAATAVFIVLH